MRLFHIFAFFSILLLTEPLFAEQHITPQTKLLINKNIIMETYNAVGKLDIKRTSELLFSAIVHNKTNTYLSEIEVLEIKNEVLFLLTNSMEVLDGVLKEYGCPQELFYYSQKNLPVVFAPLLESVKTATEISQRSITKEEKVELLLNAYGGNGCVEKFLIYYFLLTIMIVLAVGFESFAWFTLFILSRLISIILPIASVWMLFGPIFLLIVLIVLLSFSPLVLILCLLGF